MTKQEIYQEIQGLIKLLKKEDKAVYLRKTLSEKMYDTVSSDLEILEEIDTDLTEFLSECKHNKAGFDLVFKVDYILFEIGSLLKSSKKQEKKATFLSDVKNLKTINNV